MARYLTQLELIAGINVPNRQREKGEADRQHGNVHHGSAPSADLFD
jgi:hypothetical protein